METSKMTIDQKRALDTIDYILEPSRGGYYAFRKELEKSLGFKYFSCTDRIPPVTFKRFVDDLMKATQEFEEYSEVDLRNFYIALLQKLIPAKASEHVHFVDEDLQFNSPKVFLDTCLMDIRDETNPLEDIVAEMIPYLKEKRLVGVLLSFDGAKVVWIEKKSDKIPVPEEIHLYSFQWLWGTLEHIISHREQCTDISNPYYEDFCSFYMLFYFIKYACEHA